ncbi:hypothetical protein [Synechococcus sp. MIT S1220]|uniref:hypothetical protein n=1 Tax=Synechococcus sp. MIT S1220 TaxID=3082549 RepID=UPI0039AEAED7
MQSKFWAILANETENRGFAAKKQKKLFKKQSQSSPLTRHIFNSRNFSLAVDIDMQAENAVYLVCSDIDRPKDQRRRFLERCLSLRLYFSTGVS